MSENKANLASRIAEFVAAYIAADIKLPHAIRTTFDAIDANLRGGGFLNRNGGHYWLNKKALSSPKRRSLLLDEFPFVSPAARKTLYSAEPDRKLPDDIALICEHVVPCAFMENLLRDNHRKTPLSGKSVLDFHGKYYRRCIVTKAENSKLKPAYKMPKDWTTNDNVFARYEAAGFEWVEGWS